jgi:hypothetical protein
MEPVSKGMKSYGLIINTSYYNFISYSRFAKLIFFLDLKGIKTYQPPACLSEVASHVKRLYNLW